MRRVLIVFTCLVVAGFLNSLSLIKNLKFSIHDGFISADTLIYWDPEQRLTYDSIPQLDCAVWACDSFVHILVDFDYTPSVYIRSSDYGITWSDTTWLSIESSTGHKTLTQHDSVVYFAWSENREGPPGVTLVDTKYVFFRRSNDYGVTLDSAIFLGKGCMCSIDVEEETTFVATHVGSPPPSYGSYLTLSFDGGASWSGYQLILSGHSSNPNILYRNGILHFAGLFTEVQDEIAYARSTNLGLTWSADTITDSLSVLPKQPVLALGPGNDLYIAWTDNKYSGMMQFDDVLFRKSTDGGLTWGQEQRLTPDSHCDAGGALDMVTQDSIIFIVWKFIGLGSPTPCSLFFLASTNCGETWRMRETVKEGFNIGISDPNVAVVQDYVYVIWRDNQYGPTDEISMRRGSFTPPGIEETVHVFALSVSIFPNPFREILYVKWKMLDIGQGFSPADVSLKIYDVAGREVMTYDTEDETGGVKVNTQKLSSGVYFIKIENEGISSIKKIIKIK